MYVLSVVADIIISVSIGLMTRYEFRKLLESREALTRSQKQLLIDELKKELSEEASIDLIESRFEKRKRCPHYGGGELWRLGSANRLQRVSLPSLQEDMECADRHPARAAEMQRALVNLL